MDGRVYSGVDAATEREAQVAQTLSPSEEQQRIASLWAMRMFGLTEVEWRTLRTETLVDYVHKRCLKDVEHHRKGWLKCTALHVWFYQCWASRESLVWHACSQYALTRGEVYADVYRNYHLQQALEANIPTNVLRAIGFGVRREFAARKGQL